MKNGIEDNEFAQNVGNVYSRKSCAIYIVNLNLL